MDQPKRMTSLDRKIEAARLRAEAERKTQAVPQATPTEGMTSLLSTENCNVANQRKPAHGGRVATEDTGPGFNIVLEPGPVFVVGQGPAAETVAEVIEAAAAGTQPSPEQIKAAIQERERTEAQLRATWDPGQKIGDTTHFRREHLNREMHPNEKAALDLQVSQARARNLRSDFTTPEQRKLAGKAFSDGIAAGIAAGQQRVALGAIDVVQERIKLSNQVTVFLAWLANHPEIRETVVRRMRDQGVIPHDPASLPPQMGTLMRIALPPPGSKVAALGPGGLRFVVERSDKSVYLVVDGPDV